jgi:hypothetical protein
MTLLRCFLPIVLTTVFLSLTVNAQDQDRPRTSDEVAVARLKLETAQADFNKELEQEKLSVERMKAWINGVSLTVPLMVAALTFALSVRNQNQQAKLQREAQAASERAQFELKAAEVVLNERTPVGARNKARALKALFPGKLPPEFVSSFNPEEFEGPKVESFEAKKVFFEVAATKLPEIEALAMVWKKLFPGDTWVDRLHPAPSQTVEKRVDI